MGRIACVWLLFGCVSMHHISSTHVIDVGDNDSIDVLCFCL